MSSLPDLSPEQIAELLPEVLTLVSSIDALRHVNILQFAGKVATVLQAADALITTLHGFGVTVPKVPQTK